MQKVIISPIVLGLNSFMNFFNLGGKTMSSYSTDNKKKNPLKKLDYNSPVILTYALICVITFALNAITGGWLNKNLLTTYPHAPLLSIKTILNSFLYIFGHSSLSHLSGNMTLFLLVGPTVEERYSSKRLCLMIAITAFGTAIINHFLFAGIIGASGIVFMLIVLSAFVPSEKDKIPLTLVLVCILYIGNEIITGIVSTDSVSQFAHIAGGVFGLILGGLNRKYVKKNK